MSDRPTLPPAANGGDDDLEADPLGTAPAWVRHLLKSVDFLGQRVSELVDRVQMVVDNQTDLLTRYERVDAKLDDHESRIKALERKQGSASGVQKLDG